jgi:hypothetical protein
MLDCHLLASDIKDALVNLAFVSFQTTLSPLCLLMKYSNVLGKL